MQSCTSRPCERSACPELGGLFVGVSVGALLGYLDDRLQLRARWQFVGQIVLAAIALASGIVIDRLPNPLTDQTIALGTFGDVAIVAATTLWFVGMLNSVNFIDGLDGLLAGVAIIAVVALGINSLLAPAQPVVAALCALLAGGIARLPALQLPPGARVHRHGRGIHGGLRAGGAVGPGHGQGRAGAAGARRADHRHLLDHHSARLIGAFAVLRRSRPLPSSAS